MKKIIYALGQMIPHEFETTPNNSHPRTVIFLDDITAAFGEVEHSLEFFESERDALLTCGSQGSVAWLSLDENADTTTITRLAFKENFRTLFKIEIEITDDKFIVLKLLEAKLPCRKSSVEKIAYPDQKFFPINNFLFDWIPVGHGYKSSDSYDVSTIHYSENNASPISNSEIMSYFLIPDRFKNFLGKDAILWKQRKNRQEYITKQIDQLHPSVFEVFLANHPNIDYSIGFLTLGLASLYAKSKAAISGLVSYAQNSNYSFNLFSSNSSTPEEPTEDKNLKFA